MTEQTIDVGPVTEHDLGASLVLVGEGPAADGHVVVAVVAPAGLEPLLADGTHRPVSTIDEIDGDAAITRGRSIEIGGSEVAHERSVRRRGRVSGNPALAVVEPTCRRRSARLIRREAERPSGAARRRHAHATAAWSMSRPGSRRS